MYSYYNRNTSGSDRLCARPAPSRSGYFYSGLAAPFRALDRVHDFRLSEISAAVESLASFTVASDLCAILFYRRSIKIKKTDGVTIAKR